MDNFSSDERIQNLASGYVLGNLSPEEAEEFQQLLAENPEIIAEKCGK
jgi:anti-sigma-K factor RskA